jgi:hypothetical protein
MHRFSKYVLVLLASVSGHEFVVNFAHLENATATTTHAASLIVIILIVQAGLETHLGHLGQDRLPLVEPGLSQQKTIVTQSLACLGAVLERLHHPVFSYL